LYYFGSVESGRHHSVRAKHRVGQWLNLQPRRTIRDK